MKVHHQQLPVHSRRNPFSTTTKWISPLQVNRALLLPISNNNKTTSAKQVLMCTALLVFVPMSLYKMWVPAELPYEKQMNTLELAIIGWMSLLHTSIWPIIVITSLVSFFLAARCNDYCCDYTSKSSSMKKYTKNTSTKTKKDCGLKLCARKWSNFHYVVGLSFIFSILTTLQSQVHIVSPGWFWNPFLWMGRYKVYEPSGIAAALEGICLDYDPKTAAADEDQPPLCLPESSWKTLSSGGLSSLNPDDVQGVVDGIRFATSDDAGLIVNVMSRDTIDSIPDLRRNMEGLAPFFKKLSLVVYENDSVDGTREAFKAWRKEAQQQHLGYDIDLISCGEDNPDCKLGLSHRYDSSEAKDYFMSSAVGKMAQFRNLIVDHVMEQEKYKSYSHMFVTDLDLQISISPFGLLHSLGKKPENPIASSGRQTWPGSFGAMVTPYDFSAFRAMPTARNEWAMKLHKALCEIAPPGDRWRNQCDAISPIQLMLIMGHDEHSGGEPYQVQSAFNGATLYPLSLMRSSGAKYDVGDDGQRCEHIAFNVGLHADMFVNPKWDMHVSPERPGGPTGFRALKSVLRIAFTPSQGLTIFIQNIICMIIFVHCVMTLMIHVLYPFWVKIMTGTNCFRAVEDPSEEAAASGRKPSSSSFSSSKSSPTSTTTFPSWMPSIISNSPRQRKVVSDHFSQV